MLGVPLMSWLGSLAFRRQSGAGGDATAPAITSVAAPANGTYVAGTNLDFVATFDEAVDVTGTPRIQLDIGGSTVYANYLSGTGTTALTFRYTVQAGDNDSNGIGCTSPIALNSGTIKGAANNNATLTFTPPTLTGVKVDAVAPTITSVAKVSQSYDPYLFAPRGIVFRITFSEAMDTATGSGARVQMTIGSTTRYADYSGWEDSTHMLCTYLTVAGDHDEDGITVVSPLVLSSGTLKDLAGNNCALTFSPPDLSALRVVLRGQVWGSSFDQGADAQLMYGVLNGTTTSAYTGNRGQTTGADSSDPTFENYGLSFDGGDYVTLPSDAAVADIVDTTSTWSVHLRVRRIANPNELPEHWYATYASSGAVGSFLTTYRTGGNDYVYAANVNNAAPNGYIVVAPGVIPTAQWITFSIVANGTGANKITFYVDGVSIGTTSWQTITRNVAPTIGISAAWPALIGNGTRLRAISICNVAHSADEVAAAHAFLASLPNAA